MNYTAGEIAKITGAELIGKPHVPVRHIAFDSRNIYAVKKAAFAALSTDKNSGEKYIGSVIEKGVQVIISTKVIEQYHDVTWIITDNVLNLLQMLAHFHVKHSQIKTIGITGSNGKTILKEWLYQCLSPLFHTVKSPKSFNSRLGLPLSLLNINEDHQLGVFEAGISKPGEMDILSSIFSPEIGVFTHIGTAHEVNFKDTRQLISEKLKLFRDSEVIIYNASHPEVRAQIQKTYPDRRRIGFGLEAGQDVYIKNNWHDRSQEVIVVYKEKEISVPVHQRDEATLSNMLCLIAVLKEFQLTNEEIVSKINALRAVEMRLESVVGVRNNLIINDSYNLDLDSLKIAFQNVQEYNRDKKTLILTDFIEGRDEEELYREVAELTNEQQFDSVFLVGENITKLEKLFNADVFTFTDTEALLTSAEIQQLENRLILLKGARRFGIDRVKTQLELQKHDTVLEVNLNAILHNINIHKSLLKPETKMMAMVKAFSYGLGGYEIAEFLQHHHIDYLGVAFADEGVDLRKNGVTVPVIVMNPEQHSYQTIIDYNLEPEIYSFRVLEFFYEKLQQNGFSEPYPIHLKLETGMNRLGFKPEELPELLQLLATMNVRVKSVFSHLSSADDPAEKEYSREQISIFKNSAETVAKGLGYQPLRHILNSAGIVHFPGAQFEMVRIGIGMIGISPEAALQKKLKGAVRFKTVISQISTVKAGESIGYNRRFRAEKNTRIATIPVGYADGIPRLLSNGVGKVGIGGQLFPIVGNVCMDMLMVDIQNAPAKEGDEVILFNSSPTLQEFAVYCNTIPYEVLTSVSRRVKRIYIKD